MRTTSPLGANKYLVYLMGTASSFSSLPWYSPMWSPGNLDFWSPKGILPPDADPGPADRHLCPLYRRYCQVRGDPLHSWLPSAMVAPTPVSALLHAVAVVKVGVFCVARVIYNVYGPELMHKLGLVLPSAYFFSATILIASMIALTHDNLKARLAYSTVSQLAYITLGFALVSVNSMTGGAIHIANHAFAKITLFYCAGANLCGNLGKEVHLPVKRPGPVHAHYHDRLYHWRLFHDRACLGQLAGF